MPLCDKDSAGSLAEPLEVVCSTVIVVSSVLISPKARFNSMPVVVFFLNSIKAHT